MNVPTEPDELYYDDARRTISVQRQPLPNGVNGRKSRARVRKTSSLALV